MIVDNTYKHKNQKDNQKEDILINGHFKNNRLYRIILTPVHRIYEEPLVVLQFESTIGFGGRPHLTQWDIKGERKKIIN
ncbi:MAG: hypothetical protein BZ135_08985 [Methanosphaera sp. rholeuAM6]|nr:MAG: hypothetical protein BZ135_08985 [Methanosphaera sp. rholeuAM6]